MNAEEVTTEVRLVDELGATPGPFPLQAVSIEPDVLLTGIAGVVVIEAQGTAGEDGVEASGWRRALKGERGEKEGDGKE